MLCEKSWRFSVHFKESAMSVPLLRPLLIGSVGLDNNLALAPMAGTTDLVFRRICHRLGAGLTVTELVSARGICHDPQLRRNWRYLAIDPDEGQVAIQLFGSDPEDFRRAISLVLQHPLLGRCSLIDLNMGCPVAKVVKSGSGVALMRTPGLAAAIIGASVRAAAECNKPVTVKFRKGWDEASVNAAAFARICEESGAAALTVHARTGRQMYRGRADWQIIRDVKQAVQIPVYGNGDVDSAAAAVRMLRETGADGVMVGRAAQGNPWIFRQISAGMADPDSQSPEWLAAATPEEKIPVILEHLDSMISLHGEANAVREIRKQMAGYFQGSRQAAGWRKQAMTAVSRAEIEGILEEWRYFCGKSCENS
jgi:tRNA-dihydrouridine synthase B